MGSLIRATALHARALSRGLYVISPRAVASAPGRLDVNAPYTTDPGGGRRPYAGGGRGWCHLNAVDYSASLDQVNSPN